MHCGVNNSICDFSLLIRCILIESCNKWNNCDSAINDRVPLWMGGGVEIVQENVCTKIGLGNLATCAASIL